MQQAMKVEKTHKASIQLLAAKNCYGNEGNRPENFGGSAKPISLCQCLFCSYSTTVAAVYYHVADCPQHTPIPSTHSPWLDEILLHN
jgi:hypothetical protein